MTMIEDENGIRTYYAKHIFSKHRNKTTDFFEFFASILTLFDKTIEKMNQR